MKKNQNISFITGILVVLFYSAFTLLAVSRYPLLYSPTSNWLSDLGNPQTIHKGQFFITLGLSQQPCC